MKSLIQAVPDPRSLHLRERFDVIISIAEQLKPVARWRLILLAVVRAFPLTRALEMPHAGFQMA